MKEQTQQPGVRKWAGDDMIALQAEPLSAIQGFFKEYGNCIIQGCATTPAAGGKFNVAPGLLALSGMDADGEATFKVVPFSGVENVTLPLYFTLTHSVIDRVYGDGKVKPIAYDYRAVVSAVRPVAGVEFLELTTAGGRRFVDAVKITEKLDKTGNGRDVTVTFAQAANRENIASGEKLTIILGKIIRWLADLKALAFKDRVSKADMDAALQGELNGKEPGFTKNTAFNKNFGTAAGAVCQGNDARLSDARTASGGDADTVNGKSASNMFVSDRGRFAKSNINDFVSRASGTYIVEYNGGTELLTVFKGVDSSSALEFLHHFAMASGALMVRSSIDNCRYSPWQTLAFLSDLPATLPANGGRADDANKLLITNDRPNYGNGLIMNQNIDLPGAPNRTDYFSYLRLLHNNPAGYFSELAMPFTNSTRMYYRTMSSGTLGAWNPIAFLSDIPASLPANGGNANTVGGKNASDFLLKSGDQAMQGNLTLNTPNQSYVAFSRNGTKGYVGLIAGGYTHVFLSNEASGANLRADDNGKNYSNNKEIATVDQIKVLSGGAAATAGQYVSGITVNDHAITVTKEALPTTDLGSVNNRDWNTILEPGSYNTSPQLWGTNNPAGVYQYGLLTVECSGDSVVQTYCESNYATMNYRVKSTGSSFSAWTQVAKKSDVPATTAQLTEVANKKFVTDAEKTKISGSLEILCAGRISTAGRVLSSKGCSFDISNETGNVFVVTHNQNNDNLLVMVTCFNGGNGGCLTVGKNSFSIFSHRDSVQCECFFVAYKI